MKKKILLVAALLILCLAMIWIKILAVRIVLLMILLLVIYLKSSTKLYGLYIIRKFPGTVNSTQRNYDCLLLGKTARTDISGTALNLTGIGRNFHTDRLLLERYYGFLRPGGTVIWRIDERDSRYLNSKRINRFDMPALHEVTLYENGIDVYSKSYHMSTMVTGWLFLICSLTEKVDIPMGRASMPQEQIKEIQEFCAQRNIAIQFE